MSNWRTKLESTLPGHIPSPCDIENNKIKRWLLNQYPTLKKLRKYNNYDTFFIKNTMLMLPKKQCLMLYKFLSNLMKLIIYTNQTKLILLAIHSLNLMIFQLWTIFLPQINPNKIIRNIHQDLREFYLTTMMNSDQTNHSIFKTEMQTLLFLRWLVKVVQKHLAGGIFESFSYSWCWNSLFHVKEKSFSHCDDWYQQ